MSEFEDRAKDEEKEIHSIYCHVCHKGINEKNETFGEHTKTHHPLVCAVCTLKVSSPRALEQHVTESHPEINSGSDDFSYSPSKDGI